MRLKWGVVAECAALAAAYLALARLSLRIDEVSPYLSAVWPAAGLALAATLEVGPRVGPGVFFGSAAYLLTLGMPWPGALLLGAANTFEACFAAWALNRVDINGHSFYNPRDFSVYGLITAAAPAIGSLLAVWTLHHWSETRVTPLAAWGTRFLAHWTAMIIVTPVILLWKHHSRLTGSRKHLVEGILLSAFTTLAVALLFGGDTALSARHMPLTFVLMLAAIWAATRFGPRETASVLMIVAVGAGWGTLRGYGPFADVPKDTAVALLQAFLATLSLTAMTLASAMTRANDEREKARGAREQLALITDAAPALIAYIDRDQVYRFANGAYRRWYGLEPRELLGRRVAEVLPPDVYAECKPNIDRAFAGRPADFEAYWPFMNRRLWVNVSYRPDLQPDGAVAGFVALVTDISRLKEAEDRITGLNRELEVRVEQRTARLRQVNEELESFCYSVAHDLRSPLRKMSGFSEAVLQDYGSCLGAGGSDQLKRIFDASRRMARLIDDMLALSSVTRREMTEEVVDLSELARAIAAELQEATPLRKVRLVIAPGLKTRGDPGLLEILLRQLLDNAWKFTGKRSPARIEFGALPQEPSPIYFVRDDGIGFDEAQKKKLFAAFERLNSEFEGHGIGLATVQRVVQRHGGRVWAEGKPGGGAIFYFTLHDRP